MSSNGKDAKLGILVRRLHEELADHLVRIALFGSRARDDWRPDSDYDLLVVVHQRNHEIMDRILTIVTEFELEFDHDLCISSRIVGKNDFDRLYGGGYAFWENLRRDEKILWTPKSF